MFIFSGPFILLAFFPMQAKGDSTGPPKREAVKPEVIKKPDDKKKERVVKADEKKEEPIIPPGTGKWPLFIYN